MSQVSKLPGIPHPLSLLKISSSFLPRNKSRKRQRTKKKKIKTVEKEKSLAIWSNYARKRQKTGIYVSWRSVFQHRTLRNVFREKLQGGNDRFRGCHAAFTSLHPTTVCIIRFTNSRPASISAYFPFVPLSHPPPPFLSALPSYVPCNPHVAPRVVFHG